MEIEDFELDKLELPELDLSCLNHDMAEFDREMAELLDELDLPDLDF